MPITITTSSPIITNETPKEEINPNAIIALQEISTNGNSSEACNNLTSGSATSKSADTENISTNHNIEPTSQLIKAVEHNEQVRIYRA